MATFFAMPKLGLNMTHGIIVGWLVEEGEAVKVGQPVLEVETDKATQEVEAPTDGILVKIIKQEGDEVPCNVVMAVITAPGEAVPEDIPQEIAEGMAPKVEVVVDVGQKDAGVKTADPRQPQRRVNISPSAKALAKELGVDISSIVPKGSRIKREDVERAHQEQQAKGEQSSIVQANKKPMSTIRRRIVERMNRSARTVARASLTLDAEAAKLIAWREQIKGSGLKVSYNELLAKLVGNALQEFSNMNAQIVGSEIWEMTEVNIGIAVDAGERGLLVPVLHDVPGKNIAAINKAYEALTGRALQGRSTLDDLQGGTFTITNLGGLEIETFLPVINIPECAILAVGAIIKKPVVVDDQVVIQPRMALTLAFDHRLVDGAPAARFLQRVKHLIESPPGD